MEMAKGQVSRNGEVRATLMNAESQNGVAAA
jgi:hypothetical protein